MVLILGPQLAFRQMSSTFVSSVDFLFSVLLHHIFAAVLGSRLAVHINPYTQNGFVKLSGPLRTHSPCTAIYMFHNDFSHEPSQMLLPRTLKCLNSILYPSSQFASLLCKFGIFLHLYPKFSFLFFFILCNCTCVSLCLYLLCIFFYLYHKLPSLFLLCIQNGVGTKDPSRYQNSFLYTFSDGSIAVSCHLNLTMAYLLCCSTMLTTDFVKGDLQKTISSQIVSFKSLSRLNSVFLEPYLKSYSTQKLPVLAVMEEE